MNIKDLALTWLKEIKSKNFLTNSAIIEAVNKIEQTVKNPKIKSREIISVFKAQMDELKKAALQESITDFLNVIQEFILKTKKIQSKSNGLINKAMPKEMLTHVFNYLNSENLSEARLACTYWNQLITDSEDLSKTLNPLRYLTLALKIFEKPVRKKIVIAGNQRIEAFWNYFAHKKLSYSNFKVTSVDSVVKNIGKANITVNYIVGNQQINFPQLFRHLPRADLAVLCINESGNSTKDNLNSLKLLSNWVRTYGNEKIPIILVYTPLDSTKKIVSDQAHSFVKEINAIAFFDCTDYSNKILKNLWAKIIETAYAAELKGAHKTVDEKEIHQTSSAPRL